MVSSLKSNVSANRLEVLKAVEAVAGEKKIDRAIVFAALEETIAKAMRAHYGTQQDIRAEIDTDSGEVAVSRFRKIVETITDPHIEISLDMAQAHNPAATVDGWHIDILPFRPERTSSMTGRHLMRQMLREAERMSQYREFEGRRGEIITGTVRAIERGNVIVETRHGEAVMRHDQAIPRENFRTGDRIRALIVEVQNESSGPQVLLSRASPEFMLKLFSQEVPEVYEGIIKIHRIARDPGSRAKIAVTSSNSTVDPVGACVGMRGSRVQTIVNELHGERIDVIQWSENSERFIISALQPARVIESILSEEKQTATVIVPNEEDNQSKAIGRHGQNVRLASKLTGWQINIMTEEMYSEREARERKEQVSKLIEKLGASEQEAMILCSTGFPDPLDVAQTELEEFKIIEDISPERLAKLHECAQVVLNEEESTNLTTLREKGMQDDLIDFLFNIGFTFEMIEAVADWRDPAKDPPTVHTLEDFAYLETDEIYGEEIRNRNRINRRPGILSRFDISEEDSENLILNARFMIGDYSEDELFGKAANEEGDSDATETSDEAIDPTVEPTGSDYDEKNPLALANEIGEDAGQGKP